MVAEPDAPIEVDGVEGDPPAADDVGSLAADLRELAENAQTLVEAELAYQSARAAYAWNRGRGIAIGDR